MKKLFLTVSFLLAFLLFEPLLPSFFPASAQIIRQIPGQISTDSEDDSENGQKQSIFPAPPRELRRAMEDAKKLIELDRYAEAVRKLDQVLGSEEDYFFLAEPGGKGKGNVFRNLKQEAEQILETLPPKGLELYEVEFGTSARLLLNDGLEQGKMELVAQAANRFFFTRAGSEAAFLQGLDLLERQQPAAARELFLKLRANPRLGNRFEPILTLYLASADFALGRSDEAVQFLAEGKQSQAAAWKALKIGGKPLSEAVPNGASAQEFASWLKNQVPVLAQTLPEEASRDWTLLLQNQARCTDAGDFSMPILTPCWRVSMIDDPEGTVLLALMAHGSTNLPLHAPLVTGNTALMRTAWNLTAIDLQTGKKLWAVPTLDYEGIRDRLNRLEPSQKGAVQGLQPDVASHQLMTGLLKHQIFGEEAFATLASDGKLVFCVEDSIQRFLPSSDSLMKQRFNPQVPVQPIQIQPGRVIPLQGRIGDSGEEELDAADRNTVPNRLACYNIQTGKLVWHIGGQTLAQSGTMFLGAPLCAGDLLYVLGQRAGTIRLLVLESQTGKLLWSQTLCLSPSEPGSTPISCTPRLTNGVIICPTPVGALIGVNPVTHALIWGNVCGKTLDLNERRFFDTRMASIITREDQDAHLREVAASDGRLFYLTASEQGTRLVCLDPLTGKTLWTKDNLMACEAILAVNDKEVTVKMPNQISKMNVTDGSEIGHFALPPTTGLGFRSGNSLFLPHGDTLVRYSLETMKEEGRTVCHEPGRLGNLIPAGEFLLSQNAEALEAFIQDDAADDWLKRTREADATSPEAIQVEAVRLWNAGRLPEAIKLLKTGGDYTHELMKRAILAFTESSDSVKSLISGTDSGFDLNGFYSQMETSDERIHFCTQIARSFLAVKRWDDALVWMRKTVELMKSPDAAQVLIPVTDLSVSNVPKPGPERKLKQSLDVWLASTLDSFARELPPDAPMRTELKTWAETEYEPLRKEFEELKAEKPSQETRRKAENLVRSFARFRLRFRSWDGLEKTDKEFLDLLKLSRNFALLESYIIQNAPSDTEAGVELFRVYRELGDDSRAALALRWLERKFPGETVLDGKTAHEYRLALPENDPVRRILEPEFTLFPAGKITVESTDTRGNGVNRSEGELTRCGESSGVCLLEGLTFRVFQFIDGESHSVFCEDSLGRNLFSANTIPGFTSTQKTTPLINNRFSSVRFISRSTDNQFGLGTSFPFDWPMQTLSSLYSPPFRSASEIEAESIPEGFQQVGPSVTFQVKPEPVDLGLESYLKPIQKQLEEENIPALNSNPLTSFSSCKWDTRGGNVVSYGKKPDLQRFGLFEEELLWKEEQNVKYVSDPGMVKLVETEGSFIDVFKSFGQLREEWQINSENDEDSQTADDSESKPENTEDPKPQTDLSSFVPFRILRDVTLEELQKEVSSEVDRLNLKPEHFLREIQTIDPQTGLPTGKVQLPVNYRSIAGDLVWGIFGESQSPYLWNQKTRKFVWVALMDLRLVKESIPYYFNSLRITSGNSDLTSLSYALNWKHQLEVFNLKTGTHAVLEFPSAANLPKGRNGKPFVWDPKNVVSCDLLPDEDGCFTAVLSYEEYYEEPKEEQSDGLGDGSDEKSGESAEEESGENPDELLEETTNYSGEGIMLNHALICRFDANGKPLWEKSVFVPRSWMVEDLPVHIPVLCLIHQETSYVESASRDTTDAQVIQFYDRRNGKLIFDGKFPVDQRLSMVGDPVKGTARMSFQKYTFDFHFSPEPYSAEETIQKDESTFWKDQLRQKEHALRDKQQQAENTKKRIEQDKKELEKRSNLPDESNEVFKKRLQSLENQAEEHDRTIQKLEKEIEVLKKKVE